MCTFVPNGNQSIKTEETKKPEQTPIAKESVDTSPWLNYFPGWRRPDEDEFLVNL